MVPVCEGPTAVSGCLDARPNYDRLGADTEGTECLALRFSLFSEAAAFGLLSPDQGMESVMRPAHTALV